MIEKEHRSQTIKFGNYIVVVGLRENESTYRVQSVPNRFGSCALSQSCAGYYIAMNNDIPNLMVRNDLSGAILSKSTHQRYLKLGAE